MKTIATLTSLLLLAGIAFGQNDSDTTKLKIKGKKVIIVDSDSTEEVSETKKEKKKRSKFDGDVNHFKGLYLGVSGLRNNKNSLNLSPSTIELDYARSFNVQVNLFETNVAIIKEYLKLSTGLGMDFHSFRIRNNVDLFKGNTGIVESTNTTRDYQKNDLNVGYLTLPLMLGISTSQDNDKGLKIAGGVQAGYRIQGNIKKKYSLGGETFKPKVRSDLYLSPFSLSAIARVNLEKIGFYATYSLTEMFEPNKSATAMYPFAIGIRLMNFD